MLEKIFHKIILSLFIVISLPSFSFAQDSLDFYFDDSGASQMRGELSIDAAKFIDLSISPKYEYYFNDFISLSGSVTYSYGSLIPNHFFPVASIMSSVFGDSQIITYSEAMPEAPGFEGSIGVGFRNPYLGKPIKMVLKAGFIYYGQKPLQLTGQYVGFVYEHRLVEKDRFFLSLELGMDILFNVWYDNEYYEGDISVGYGLNIGFKL
ncbi:MAG: hypothetical protein DRI86_12850 [Bacteroidetes bacterium]|nr:MAG: hypothetical protein DRI86_12850 [Bacteroidota bacterium]